MSSFALWQHTPDQQIPQTAFIEVLTLADDQLIKYLWLAGLGCYLLLDPVEAVRVDLPFDWVYAKYDIETMW